MAASISKHTERVSALIFFHRRYFLCRVVGGVVFASFAIF